MNISTKIKVDLIYLFLMTHTNHNTDVWSKLNSRLKLETFDDTLQPIKYFFYPYKRRKKKCRQQHPWFRQRC